MTVSQKTAAHLARLNEAHVIRARLPVGTRNGTLMAIGHVKRRAWGLLVRCDCGKLKFMAKGNFLRAKSCGCLTREILSSARKRHGQTDTPTWKSWKSMLERCYRKSHKSWSSYGGRGITVCERWHTYEHFAADMGQRPEGLQLDRTDNALGYKPGNCRWATPMQNSNNRRSTIYHDFNGERRTHAEWARKIGLSISALQKRFEKGWSVREALTRPRRKQAAHHSDIVALGGKKVAQYSMKAVRKAP